MPSFKSIDNYIAILLMWSFYFTMPLQVVAMFGGCTYFVVRSLLVYKTWSISKIGQALLLGMLYIAYLVAAIFTPEPFRQISLTLCEYKMSYLLLPLLLSLFAQEYLLLLWSNIQWFIISTLSFALIGNIAFLVHYLPLGFSDVNHVVYRIYFESVIGQHPTYISMFLVFSAGLLLLSGAINWPKQVKLALMYLILLLLLPLLAKAPLGALVLIVIHQLWVRRQSLAQYKWGIIGLMLVAILACVFVPFISQRLLEMTQFASGKTRGMIIENSMEARKLIWVMDTQMLKKYYLLGCSPGRMLHLLHVRYFFYSLYIGKDISFYDPHNEYFMHWLSLGLLGVGLFLTNILTHIRTAFVKYNVAYMYLMLICCISFCTESILSVQRGIIFYCFFTAFFYFAKRNHYQLKVP